MPCGNGWDWAKATTGARKNRAAIPNLMKAGRDEWNMMDLSRSLRRASELCSAPRSSYRYRLGLRRDLRSEGAAVRRQICAPILGCFRLAGYSGLIIRKSSETDQTPHQTLSSLVSSLPDAALPPAPSSASPRRCRNPVWLYI